MNIDKIIKECPKAFDGWLRYELSIGKAQYEILEIDYYAHLKNIYIRVKSEFGITEYYIHPRSLYDYFDSVGIKIEITHIGNSYGWIFDICASGKSTPDHEGSFDSRTEAEYVAFEKAFEIREQQLNEV